MDALGVPGHLNATEQRAAQLSGELSKMQGLAESTKAIYETAAGQIRAGQEPPAIDEMMARDPLVASYRQQVDSIDIALAEFQKLGEDHPYLKQLNGRREASMKKYIDTRAEQLGKYRSSLLDKLKTDATMSQMAVDSQNKALDQVRNELAALTEDLNVYLSTMEEEKSIRDTLKSIEKELDDIKAYNLRADQAGVFWSQKPDVPDTMSFPKLSLSLAFSIMLGLALSLGLAFLREMLDTSVRSPRDIARVGQMNILGMVPDEGDDPAVAGVRLPLAIFEAPNSAFAEQLRQMRTRLQHTVSLDTTRAILVTSAGPEDGKTTIACNLAAGLALNGRKILLVDANFRRPQVHNVFAMANDQGFSDALNAPDGFAAFVKPSSIPNLAVLPSGAKPGNATEMLESQLLIDFIDRALDEYDHVIFDSGPMLFVSETVAMAPRVDGVVTVVRAQQNSRGALQRMRDALRQIKAQHIGVVLNAVRAQGGGYYAQNIRTHYEYQGLPAKQG
jgi:capsular exopolysaccharide synthesis family protein